MLRMTIDKDTGEALPIYGRDPLYELEMCRALLDDARRQPNQNAILVRGLENEVAWWLKCAVKVCQQ